MLESAEPGFASLVARFTGAVKDRDWTLLSALLAPRGRSDSSSGLVTAIDAMWNGALASGEQLSSISRQAIEH